MRIYDTIRLLILVLMTGTFASCWDDFEEQSFNSANLNYFYFEAQDTCFGIEYYIFNIDQFNGLVYNLDSLPYGSKVDYLLPSITFQSTNGVLYLNDSLWKEKSDTLDFSKPVKLTNTSSDGIFTRSYLITVNVHQVNPDSMIIHEYPAIFPVESSQNKVFAKPEGGFIGFLNSATNGFSVYQSDADVTSWNNQTVTGLTEPMTIQSLSQFNSKYYASSLSGKLFMSTDGLNWIQTGDSTFVVTLFGSLSRKYLSDPIPYHLIGLIKNNSGDVCFAKSSDGLSWETGANVNEDFPVYDYGVVKGSTVTNVQYYTVASGLRTDGAFSSSVWATENGLDWVLVSSNLLMPVSSVKGVSLFYYDNNLVCFGGIKSDGSFVKKVSVSKDHGKTWIKAPKDWVIPSVESGLAFGCVNMTRVEDIVNDKDREFFWYFGGLNANGISPQVWKGYEHKMVFIRR